MTITLVTGANRGIGYHVAQQLHALGHTVYLGARDTHAGAAAAAKIGASFVPLDVTDDESVRGALRAIREKEGRLDLLVNNAGIQEFGPFDGPAALRSFDANAVGVVRVTEAALDLLAASADPRVVTVTSSAGSFWAVTTPERPESQLTGMLYAASKAAANMLSLQYAKAYPAVRFLAVEPGYTATDMTAAFPGGRAPEDSAAVIVRTAMGDMPTGSFSDENGHLAW